MFGKIGMGELMLVLCIVLLIFGPSKLPSLAKSIGQAVKEFRKGASNISKELDDLSKEDDNKDNKSEK